MSIAESFNYEYEDKFEMEDVNNRHLYINGEITADAITSIVYHILRYNRIDKDLAFEKRKPIYIYINSPGGSVCDGYSIIDAIRLSSTPVYTINVGLAASMAFLIYIAGHKRFSFPSSEFLMHDGSIANWNSYAKAKDRMEFEAGEMEDLTKNYVISRTNIDEDLYREKYRVEWYMLPKVAKEHGIVDLIVGTDCSFDEVC